LARHYDEGAVHMLEAALASVLVMAALFYVNSATLWTADGRSDDLRSMSSDVLNVLEYRDNSIEHPALGFALSSAAQWSDSSDELDADIVSMLPDGVYYYLETPYGGIGQRPVDGMGICSRPLVVYGGPGNVLDCKFILWRA
jgi:hypothetical protein